MAEGRPRGAKGSRRDMDLTSASGRESLREALAILNLNRFSPLYVIRSVNGEPGIAFAAVTRYIRRYRDSSSANRPKAKNPSATAVSRNLPSGCARIVCSAPSSPGAFCCSKVSAA